jgi:hypothetical protein
MPRLTKLAPFTALSAILAAKLHILFLFRRPKQKKSDEKFSNCLENLEIMPIPRSVRSNVLA